MQKSALIFSLLVVFMLTTVLHDAFSQCHGCNDDISHSRDYSDNGDDKDVGPKESLKHCGHLHIFSLSGVGAALPVFQSMKDRAVVIYSGGDPLHLAEPLLQPPLQA